MLNIKEENPPTPFLFKDGLKKFDFVWYYSFTCTPLPVAVQPFFFLSCQDYKIQTLKNSPDAPVLSAGFLQVGTSSVCLWQGREAQLKTLPWNVQTGLRRESRGGWDIYTEEHLFNVQVHISLPFSVCLLLLIATPSSTVT